MSRYITGGLFSLNYQILNITGGRIAELKGAITRSGMTILRQSEGEGMYYLRSKQLTVDLKTIQPTRLHQAPEGTLCSHSSKEGYTGVRWGKVLPGTFPVNCSGNLCH